MNILITGVAGFIGSNFYKKFKHDFPNHKIIGIDDFSSGKKENVGKDLIFYKGSITDTALLEKIFSKHKLQYIFHFAAIPRVSYSVQFPLKTAHTNICGTVSLLEMAKKYKVRRFILSSSSSVYGGAKKLPTKESENFPNPKSPYAAEKYTDEIFCRLFSELYNLDTVCLRYFNVFGPGQYGDSAYSSVISAWLENLYFPSGKKAFIEGNGRQTRDFCFVENVVLANIKAMLTKRKFLGEAINIAHGERISVNEVRRVIEGLTAKKINLEKRPTRIGDVKDSLVYSPKASKLLDYKPRVNFEEGMKKTVEWFKQRKK